MDLDISFFSRVCLVDVMRVSGAGMLSIFGRRELLRGYIMSVKVGLY